MSGPKSKPEHMTGPEIFRTLSAFAEAHNPALADPFQYERAECARLVKLVRQNHKARFISKRFPAEPCEGDYQFKPGPGWYRFGKTTPPADMQAVARLWNCLRNVPLHKTEADRLREAKQVWYLLTKAQELCGGETLETRAGALPGLQRSILLAMARAGAYDVFSGVAISELLKRLPGANHEHVKDTLRAMTGDTIGAHGERRWRRYFLLPAGALLAEFLDTVL